MSRYPVIDFPALFAPHVDLLQAFAELEKIYNDIDGRNTTNTKNLDLPCHKGCSACCYESVFLTPLEFIYAWHWAQQHLPEDIRNQIIDRGIALYQQHQSLIDAFNEAPPEGDKDHFKLAEQLKFPCPILGPQGECQIYPARELYARLFGCSFLAPGELYGCNIVRAHLLGKTVQLLSVRPAAQLLNALPLSHKRQVYPYYFWKFFGEVAAL